MKLALILGCLMLAGGVTLRGHPLIYASPVTVTFTRGTNAAGTVLYYSHYEDMVSGVNQFDCGTNEQAVLRLDWGFWFVWGQSYDGGGNYSSNSATLVFAIE